MACLCESSDEVKHGDICSVQKSVVRFHFDSPRAESTGGYSTPFSEIPCRVMTGNVVNHLGSSMVEPVPQLGTTHLSANECRALREVLNGLQPGSPALNVVDPKNRP